MRCETASEPKKRAEPLRKELGITQVKAAKLLNISKNTWIRWEHGECKPDVLALQLLPLLARESVPEPCENSRRKAFNPYYLAQHIELCSRCRLAVKYVTIVGKL